MIDPTQLLALLKRLEWRQVYYSGDPITECAICGETQPNHAEDCELSALIASLEAEGG